MAAISLADKSLTSLSNAIYELRPLDDELNEAFNEFASVVAKKLAAKVTMDCIKEAAQPRVGDITTWYKEI